MFIQRREVLRTLSFAFWSSFFLSRNQFGLGAQTAYRRVSILPLRGPLFATGSLEEWKWKK